MVRGRAGAAKIGIFAEGSHRVVDIPTCPIHHPLINRAAASLKASMRELRTSPYADAPHAGLVRALQVVVERSTQTAQLVLVCNSSDSRVARPLFARLAEHLGSALHSLWWNGNPERTNTILGAQLERVSGPEAVIEQLGGAQVFYPPAAFGQNNLELFDRLLGEIHAGVPAERDVVELYAGSGAIGLGLAARSRSLVMNEIGSASLAGLALGLDALPPAARARCRVVPGPAEAAADEIQSDRVVIVDPPRKGLDPAVLQALMRARPERVAYVSCGLSTFLRDAQALIAGGLELTSATLYDLFPYTAHVETLAWFRPATTR